jgi:hypothetical protein
MEFKKVLERNDGVRSVVIPRDSGIAKGDYVLIIKMFNQEEFKEKVKEAIKCSKKGR